MPSVFGTAFVGMLMLMADRAGGNKLALEIGGDCGVSITLGANNHLYAALVEYLHCRAAHAAGNNYVRSFVGKEIGQKSRPVTGVGN